MAKMLNARASARAVEKQLARYRSMRDFAVTPEPSGGSATKTASKSAAKSSVKISESNGAAAALPFVIQKHAATRLHYDFRLGWNGVLKSWAVAKGPSYYPGDKRLAVEVEDHPMEYGGFEGTIPKGQYGGGTVMVWDEGTWEPVGDADQMLSSGNLKFMLNGHKMHGKWALVRMKNRDSRDGKHNWLLIKERDEFAGDENDTPVTESEPDSVVTGRGLDEIARHEDHVWNSNQEPRGLIGNGGAPSGSGRRGAEEPKTKAKRGANPLAGVTAPKEALPKFIEPQLASTATIPPKGKGWVHELKLDG